MGYYRGVRVLLVGRMMTMGVRNGMEMGHFCFLVTRKKKFLVRM